MTVRLLLDEMYPPKLDDSLRDRGHDVIAVAASVELWAVMTPPSWT